MSQRCLAQVGYVSSARLNLGTNPYHKYHTSGLEVAAPIGEDSEDIALAGVSRQGELVVKVWNAVSGKVSNEYSIPANLLTASGQALSARKVSVGVQNSPSVKGFNLRYTIPAYIS